MRPINLLIICLSATLLQSCFAIRAYRFTRFKLSDYDKMAYKEINNQVPAFLYIRAVDNTAYQSLKEQLDTSLSNTLTAAFLVVRHDSIVYENYFDGYNERSLLPSFSMAKSYVSTLIGIALEEGSISSLQDPITKYIPVLLKKDKRFAKITLQHLLDMRSGLHFNEGSYGLKDDAIRLGFRPNIRKYAMKVGIEKDPGGLFNYQSVNTLFLAMALQKATGKTPSQYLEEKLWKPLGCESRAAWNTDNHGLEIGYAGINSTARDYAKLGSLYLHNGTLNGKQILSVQWIERSVGGDSMFAYGGYHNQWWGVRSLQEFSDSLQADDFRQKTGKTGKVVSYINPSRENRYFISTNHPAFHAQGLLGQFIYVFPEKDLVIVRLGRFWKHPVFHNPKGFITTLANGL